MANHNHQPESGQKIDEELSDFLMAVLLLYLRCTSLKSKPILLFFVNHEHVYSDTKQDL